jgi:hypothetical protein
VIGGTEVSSFLLMTVAMAQRALAEMSETVGETPTEWRAMIALHCERHG